MGLLVEGFPRILLASRMTEINTDESVYQKAPIREAMFDIRVRFDQPVSLPELKALSAAVKENYPRTQSRVSFESNVSLPDPKKAPITTATPPKEDGYLHFSADGKQVFQARVDGFTFNRIYPYDRWATFSAEAKKLWNIYEKVGGTGKITRIALRYINAIPLPIPCKIEDYIRTTPTISPDLPQDIQNFFMRLVLPFPAINAFGLVIATMEQPHEGRLPLIFDIDVFKNIELDFHDDSVWKHFSDLRDLKNLIFEKSTTATAKELFK
jgi:uncharacterized protein (TIGR04255 family)